MTGSQEDEAFKVEESRVKKLLLVDFLFLFLVMLFVLVASVLDSDEESVSSYGFVLVGFVPFVFGAGDNSVTITLLATMLQSWARLRFL